MKGKQSVGKGTIKVRGVVTPTEWDMRDEVTAVTIYTQDDQEYTVTARSMVKRLLKHMDEEIEAHGTVTPDEYGNDVFIMTDFTPLESSEEEEEDDWDDLEDIDEEDADSGSDLEEEDWDEAEDEGNDDAWSSDRDERGGWRKGRTR